MAVCLPYAIIVAALPFATILCADNECDSGGGGWAYADAGQTIGSDEGAVVTTRAMAFSAAAVNEVGGIIPRPVYEGSITDAGAVTWTQRMDLDTYNVGVPAPLRIAANGTDNPLLQYDQDIPPDYNFTMYGYDGTLYEQAVSSYAEAHDWPYWEEFDMAGTALAVMIISAYGDGYKIRVSSDYGRTWGAKTDIDYLYALIGDVAYSAASATANGMSVQYDEVSEIFYCLVPYVDPVSSDDIWILMSSVTGTTWTFVESWNTTSLELDQWYCSLAVSDDHLYVGFRASVGAAAANYYCMYSSDGGTTWGQSTVHTEAAYRYFLNVIQLAANGATVIAYVTRVATIVPFPFFDETAYVYRSSDSGATWTEVLHVDPPDTTPRLMIEYPVLRASSNAFLVTFCNAASPINGMSWTSGGSENDMSGDNPSYLAFWISLDDGLTWALRTSPILYKDALGDYQYWQQSLDVSVVTTTGGNGGGGGDGDLVTETCPPYAAITDTRPMAVFDCTEEECDI